MKAIALGLVTLSMFTATYGVVKMANQPKSVVLLSQDKEPVPGNLKPVLYQSTQDQSTPIQQNKIVGQPPEDPLGMAPITPAPQSPAQLLTPTGQNRVVQTPNQGEPSTPLPEVPVAPTNPAPDRPQQKVVVREVKCRHGMNLREQPNGLILGAICNGDTVIDLASQSQIEVRDTTCPYNKGWRRVQLLPATPLFISKDSPSTYSPNARSGWVATCGIPIAAAW